MNKSVKIFFTITTIVALVLAGFLYFKFWFVYSEGCNEGDINYFQREGFVFKTYEGKMIQTGYNSKNSNATIQSNEFKFSVEDPRIAAQIEAASSRQIKLHWCRYLGKLPWRGNSEFVVDSVITTDSHVLSPSTDPIIAPQNE